MWRQRSLIMTRNRAIVIKPTPQASFPIGASGILAAWVFVNRPQICQHLISVNARFG